MKYADGELERLGIYKFSKLIAYNSASYEVGRIDLLHYPVMLFFIKLLSEL